MGNTEEIIFVVQEEPEGGYSARALGTPIFTEADTVDELRDAVRDAMRCHFDRESIKVGTLSSILSEVGSVAGVDKGQLIAEL
jgi:hypothetical protein